MDVKNWARSTQSNWNKNWIITIGILDYPNLVPINFKILNQLFETLVLKPIRIHNSCCQNWKSVNRAKTYTILLFD